MRIPILLTGLLWSALAAQGQNYQKVVIPLITNEIFPLSSRGTGLFTKGHQIALEVDLPDDCVAWHYRFIALPINSEKDQALPSLLTDVQQYLIDSTQKPQWKAAQLQALELSRVNIYLLKDSTQLNSFQSTFSYSGFQHLSKYSRMGSSGDWVMVTDPKQLKGKQYLGISNYQALQETALCLEAVAVVRQPIAAQNNWTVPALDQWYADIIDYCATLPDSLLHPSQFTVVAQCFTNTLEQQIDAISFSEMDEVQQQKWKSWMISKCLSEGRQAPKFLSSELDPYLLAGQWISEKKEILEFSASQSVKLTKQDNRILRGTWKIEDGTLSIIFKGFKNQHYRPVSFSRNYLSLENQLTGKYLRLTRSIR